MSKEMEKLVVENSLLKERVEHLETKFKLLEIKYDGMIQFIEQMGRDRKTLPDGKSNPPNVLNNEMARALFDKCSPFQHAIMQLCFDKKSNADISDRFGRTPSSINSTIHHLYNRLQINGRQAMIVNYKKIFDEYDNATYKEKFIIPKTWSSRYGKLSFSDAMSKDPYFDVMKKRQKKASQTA